jgi:hypothetical protein
MGHSRQATTTRNVSGDQAAERGTRSTARAAILDSCSSPQALALRRRAVALIARAVAVNSGMLRIPLFPLALMGIGFSMLQKHLKTFAALSRRDLESLSADRLSLAVG